MSRTVNTSRSITQARDEFFALVNAAMYHQQTTIVTKQGKAAAKIVPADEQPFDWNEYWKVVKSTRGVFTKDDVKQIKAARENSKARYTWPK